MGKSIKITKSRFFYKDKTGDFKPLYAHKYLKDFGISGRKSYIKWKKSKNSNSGTYHGKFYTKKQTLKNRK